MERIDLPRVTPDDSPGDVFGRMAQSGCHAALVDGPKPKIVFNLHVDQALDAGLKRIGDAEGFPVHVSRNEPADWESTLDVAAHRYGVTAERGATWKGAATMTIVVTRHEGLAYEIRALAPICRCKPYRHKSACGAPCQTCGDVVQSA